MTHYKLKKYDGVVFLEYKGTNELKSYTENDGWEPVIEKDARLTKKYFKSHRFYHHGPKWSVTYRCACGLGINVKPFTASRYKELEGNMIDVFLDERFSKQCPLTEEDHLCHEIIM